MPVIRTILVVLVALVAGWGCVSTQLEPIPSGESPFRPVDAAERELWRAADDFDRSVAEADLIYSDPALRAYLDAIVARLDPEGARSGAIRVLVIKNPFRSAFALPNGSLYLHTGLITALQNEAQLAVVIAHELAHFRARHAARAERATRNRETARTALRLLLGVAAAAAAGDPSVGLALADGVSASTGALVALTVGGYDKRQEVEADQMSLEQVARAGYPVEEAPRVFEHLKSELELSGVEEPVFFGSHPTLDARIRSAKGFLEENPTLARGGADPASHRSAIAALEPVNARFDLAIDRAVFARASLRRHLEHNPQSVEGWLVMGELQRRSEEPEEASRAEASLERAAALDREAVEPERELGLLKRRRGDGEGAQVHFEGALAKPGVAEDARLLRWYRAVGEPSAPARAGRERWLMLPVALPQEVGDTVALAADFESDLRLKLGEREIELLESQPVYALWEEMKAALFAQIGPDSEAVYERKFELLRRHFRNELAARYDHDAMLVAQIQIVGARFASGSASWCGVSQSVKDPDSGFWDSMGYASYEGVTRGLCLVAELYDPEGLELETGVGGIELFTVLSGGAQFRDRAARELFRDAQRNRTAVGLAVGGLFPAPPPTLSDDPACRSVQYRPWAKHKVRCRADPDGEDERE